MSEVMMNAFLLVILYMGVGAVIGSNTGRAARAWMKPDEVPPLWIHFAVSVFIWPICGTLGRGFWGLLTEDHCFGHEPEALKTCGFESYAEALDWFEGNPQYWLNLAERQNRRRYGL